MAQAIEIRDRLARFLRQNVTDPGILAVVVDREQRVLMAMFTYSLSSIMFPSNDASEAVLHDLKRNEEFHDMSNRDKFLTIQKYACGIDCWDRQLAGGRIVQAIMSCAAGLKTIMYSDDRRLDSNEISNKLYWNHQLKSTMEITKTVWGAIGYVGGIHNTAIEAFDPYVFESDFLLELDNMLPALHLAGTMNKIVFYDLQQSHTIGDVPPTSTHTTTTEVPMPVFPLPFSRRG